jgi:hypothetical protein
MPSTFLPHSVLPHTRVVRPAGNWPLVISSRPSIPVGLFLSEFLAGRTYIFRSQDWSSMQVVEALRDPSKTVIYAEFP